MRITLSARWMTKNHHRSDSVRSRRRARGALVLWLCVALLVPAAAAGEDASAAPDPSKRYVFYLHGKIVEDAGRRPTHPRWGVYEYDAIVRALAAEGAIVISEVRAKGTRVDAYADKVRGQIEALLAAGVPAPQVAVVGFSKGGVIAQRIAARLDADVRYVLLAGCFDAGAGGAPLHGRLLSIREQSDHLARSCKPLVERMHGGPARGSEITIDVGGEHGAFYRPQRAWLEPLLRFLRG